MKSKKFDSVKMMRDIRQKLGKKYYGQPQMLLQDLEVIREKYALKQKGHADKAGPA